MYKNLKEFKSRLKDPEKVQVLLHEYDSLRTEITHRTNNMYQVAAIGGAVFVWFVSRPINIGSLVSLTVSAIILFLFFWFIRKDTYKAAKRLRQLEKDINRRAGEELLLWETKYGAATTPFEK